MLAADHCTGDDFGGWLAVSVWLRDRQREYFYNQLDQHFPGTRQKYQRAFGDRYECSSPNANHLYNVVNRLCEAQGIVTQLPLYQPQYVKQMNLFRCGKHRV